MPSIALNSIQDIKSHSFNEIRQAPTITIGDKKYTVQVTQSGDVSVSRDLSGVKYRHLNAIKDFFSRMCTSGEHATETRANTLKTLIQSKNPTKMEHLTSRMKEKGISHHYGANRDVYIVKSEGRGYKFPTREGGWTGGEFRANPDLRLNNIYQSKEFYGGKYEHFATHRTMKIDDMDVPVFDLIEGAEPLRPKEKIPLSTLKMMENARFIPFDVKPDNFVKKKNESGSYDYIPIDAKLIGLERSRSIRTEDVSDLKQNNNSYDYFYDEIFVDRSA